MPVSLLYKPVLWVDCSGVHQYPYYVPYGTSGIAHSHVQATYKLVRYGLDKMYEKHGTLSRKLMLYGSGGLEDRSISDYLTILELAYQHDVFNMAHSADRLLWWKEMVQVRVSPGYGVGSKEGYKGMYRFEPG